MLVIGILECQLGMGDGLGLWKEGQYPLDAFLGLLIRMSIQLKPLVFLFMKGTILGDDCTNHGSFTTGDFAKVEKGLFDEKSVA